MGMHWCLSVINFKKKRFEYYDSLFGQNDRCLTLLKEYIINESLDKKKWNMIRVIGIFIHRKIFRVNKMDMCSIVRKLYMTSILKYHEIR